MTERATQSIEEFQQIKCLWQSLTHEQRQDPENQFMYKESIKKMDEACDNAKLEFFDSVVGHQDIDWKDLTRAIKYDSTKSKAIPTWVEKGSKLVEAVTSQQKADQYQAYHHRFDKAWRREQKEDQKSEINDEFEEKIHFTK